ncbi:MAG TPA: hypothetical protein VH227_02645 [Candidatus Udaeobacter sp.]|jgi:hypothetical protein|nr:hypothetical protein [Candidatus Udaeobacter sp.]
MKKTAAIVVGALSVIAAIAALIKNAQTISEATVSAYHWTKGEGTAPASQDDSLDLAGIDSDQYKPLDSACPRGDPESLRSKVVGDWIIKTENDVTEYPVTLTGEMAGYTSKIHDYGRDRSGNPINQPFFSIDSHGVRFPTGPTWIFYNGAIVFNRADKQDTGRPVKIFRGVNANQWAEVPVKHVHGLQRLVRTGTSP